MARSRNAGEVEKLKGLIRKLQKENKQLQKQLGRANKHARRAADVDGEEDDFAPLEPTAPRTDRCPSCNSYDTKTIEIGAFNAASCKACGRSWVIKASK